MVDGRIRVNFAYGQTLRRARRSRVIGARCRAHRG